MKKRILVTDELFISESHEKELFNRGFEVVRLNKLSATEDELIDALKNVNGYILGGTEIVTERVIESTKHLEAIVFTGAGYKEFIPSYKLATEKGIAIANAPGGNAASVSEYTLGLMIAMTRSMFTLGKTGKTEFMTTNTLSNMSIGIIGLGHIGLLLAKSLKSMGVADVRYYSKTRHYELEEGFGLYYDSMEEIFRRCDIVSLHVEKDAGDNFVSKNHLSMMKDNSILINTSYPEVVDIDALYLELKNERLKSAFDAPPQNKNFKSLPLSHWFASNLQTAYNTEKAINTVNNMVVQSMISLLTTGEDHFLVNPRYKDYK